MSDGPAIIADNISKMYHKRAGTGTLLSMIPGFRPSGSDEFWALKDISFEVKRGECLGIIGSNGAGKSTILKILSRVTPPTSGTYRVNGRMSSLIEVGAGFHPELTGRENVYLNAAILGMSKKETETKFDEIVDFAELWDFIDVPIKRYSSGMHVRLGFAVAAHVDPDVLLVDEVLAVGDTAFREKCLASLGRMRAGHDGAVILVSHNLQQIAQHCDRALFLHHGQIAFDGESAEACRFYLKTVAEGSSADEGTTDDRFGLDVPGDEQSGFESIQMNGMEPPVQLDSGAPLTLDCHFRLAHQPKRPVVAVMLYTEMGEHLTTFSTIEQAEAPPLEAGASSFRLHLPQVPLRAGRYALSIAIQDGGGYLLRKSNLQFEVSGPRLEKGHFLPQHHWEW